MIKVFHEEPQNSDSGHRFVLVTRDYPEALSWKVSAFGGLTVLNGDKELAYWPANTWQRVEDGLTK